MNKKKEISDLTKLLLKWEHAYYALDNPLVSDEEYDYALKKLIELENKYPQWKDKNSPTTRVGGVVLDKFNKIHHLFPMLSLNNAFNKEDINRFNKQIIETIYCFDNEYVVEPKIDGLSISLIYENNELFQAVTRGDGIDGEDVTENVKTIRTIPLKISTPFSKLIIRGEVFISKENFEKINASLSEDKKFANPRNLAAGSIRNLDSKIASQRKLNAFLYYIPNAIELGFKTHWEVLQRLKEWGFNVSNDIKLINNIDKVWNEITWFQENRKNLSYAIDGVVLKLNNLKKYSLLGNTAKFPRWAIAYKFPATKVITQLIGINTTVGRTGKINYIAKLKKVNIDGTFVSNATLHNYDYIREKDIRVNDYVEIYKAGDIIPKVLDVVLSKRTDKVVKFDSIEICPECGQKLEYLDGEINQYCINSTCPALSLQSIIHYCSRDAMNIEGVSEKIIETFYRYKFIDTIYDLYLLKNKRCEILSGPFRIKEKKISNILNSIESSKNRNLSNLLFGLGIRHVGYTTAKMLAKKYETMDALMNASYDDLLLINDIGPIVAKSIIDWFSISTNQDLIFKLKNINIQMHENILDINSTNFQIDSPYYKKTFLITGSFSIPRSDIKEILSNKFDAQVRGTISKNVDFLLVGNNPTNSKIDTAKKLGITIIYNEFWN